MLDAGKIQPAPVGSYVLYVTHPSLVWRAHAKMAFWQIRCDWQIVLRIGRISELAFLLVTKPQFGTNAPDAVNANGHAVIEQLCLKSLVPRRPPGPVREPLQFQLQDGCSPVHAAIRSIDSC